MQEHRFQEYFDGLESPVAIAHPASVSSSAFVFCPCFATMGVDQLSRVNEVYRLAFERAQAEVAQERRSRRFEFSMN